MMWVRRCVIGAEYQPPSSWPENLCWHLPTILQGKVRSKPGPWGLQIEVMWHQIVKAVKMFKGILDHLTLSVFFKIVVKICMM